MSEPEQPDAVEAEPAEDTLPTLKADLVALAIERKVPSYVAWDMNVEQLRDKLKEA